jgi:hypothetical protein
VAAAGVRSKQLTFRKETYSSRYPEIRVLRLELEVRFKLGGFHYSRRSSHREDGEEKTHLLSCLNSTWCFLVLLLT